MILKPGFANEKNLSKAKKMSKNIVKYGINIESKVDKEVFLLNLLMKVFINVKKKKQSD